MDRSATILIVGTEVHLHILAVYTAAIIAYGLARIAHSRHGLMAMLAETSPRRQVLCRPVLATEARTSPLTPPARGTHRRTMLSDASLTCSESDAVGVLSMTAFAFTNVVCQGKAIEASLRVPASPLRGL